MGRGCGPHICVLRHVWHAINTCWSVAELSISCLPSLQASRAVDDLAPLLPEPSCRQVRQLCSTYIYIHIQCHCHTPCSASSPLYRFTLCPHQLQRMCLLLLREKYLELLEEGREMEALQCLRHELVPLPLYHLDKNIQVLTR